MKRTTAGPSKAALPTVGPPNTGVPKAGVPGLRLPSAILRGAIRAYQLTFSAWLGRQCRFGPSCSEYALEAVERHGAVRGGWLAVKRMCRCHPWGGSGYDPVPDLSTPSGRVATPDKAPTTSTRSTRPSPT